MLVELRLVEQRHQAVLEVFAGVSITQVAQRYGVTRQTVHAWLRRYGTDGIAGLADHTSRPATCPHQMPPEIEARILSLRLEHPGWGPRTILHELKEEALAPVPSRSSVYRCLLRHELITPEPRKRKRADYRRWERTRSMELWQMDVMGGVMLTDGTDLKVVTGIDDHSRFCVSALLVSRATARPVCEALAAALRRYGVPDQILTDNGKVFTGRFGPGTGEVLFDRICRENGIRHLLTAPHSPTTTGKVERFHKTVRVEFLGDRVFASLEEAQDALDTWVERYNERRPHQGIGMVTPATRFALASPEPVAERAVEVPEADAPAAPPGKMVSRVVTRGGRISLASFPYHVGAWLTGETVNVVVRDDGLLEIFHRGVLVKVHARRHPPGVVPKAQPRPRARPVPRAVPPLLPPRPDDASLSVLRLVDVAGCASFAGTAYRVGKNHAGEQVEVRLLGETVEIWLGGECIRTHSATHDRTKEHGAFATPAGRPRKVKAG